jgi:hypothetical protein
MADKIDPAMRAELEEALDSVFTEDALKSATKKVRDILADLEDDFQYGLQERAAYSLTCRIVDMAERAVEQLLAGNEDQMRRYLSCEKRGEDGEYIGWTGRSDSTSWGWQREQHEWHPIIHGRLFEQGAVELRKKIVDAHREVLVNERVLDLEDQVRSLVAQNGRLENEKERLVQRIRDAA